MRKKDQHFKKGVMWILIVVVIMLFLLLGAFAGASTMVGDRTGSGSGSSNPGGSGGSATAPVVPVAGTCPQVQTMQQYVGGWCGVASSAQVIAFWQGDYAKYASRAYMESWGGLIQADKLNRDSGKSYHYTDSVQEVVDSLAAGKPVIAYTALYSNMHIIVLTCYDDATKTFTANDSEPKTKGGQQSVQKIGGVPLTVSNLTGRYSGHGPYPSHPMFLVTN